MFPSNFSRDWACPATSEENLDPAVWVPDSVALADAPVNTTALEAAGVPGDVQMCLFMLKRGLGGSGDVRTQRFCSGSGEILSFETWSSSKFIAMGNAAGKLREECTNGVSSLGLDASVTYSSGPCTNAAGLSGVCADINACSFAGGVSYAGLCNGPAPMQCCVGAGSGSAALTPLGDLATVVASYDTTAGLTSNSVSSYFHDLGWRSRALELAQSWLRPSPSAQPQSLGGNYGEPTPAYLGFTAEVSASGASASGTSASDVNASARGLGGELSGGLGGGTCAATVDPAGDGPYSNSLTALALAEAHRRLALHREVDLPLAFPNATWADAAELLYGAEASVLFPGTLWGGLTADPAIFVQAGLEKALEAVGLSGAGGALAAMDTATGGLWRVHSKLGAGYSTSRKVGEIVTAGYGCVPSWSSGGGDGGGSGAGENQGGWEFTIAARGSVPLDYDLSKVELRVASAVEAALLAMATGKL